MTSDVATIAALLAKAERTDNAHEAEVFSRKAAELVARHRIDPDRTCAISLPHRKVRHPKSRIC